MAIFRHHSGMGKPFARGFTEKQLKQTVVAKHSGEKEPSKMQWGVSPIDYVKIIPPK